MKTRTRRISREGRRNIRAAVARRWAAYRAQKAAGSNGDANGVQVDTTNRPAKRAYRKRVSLEVPHVYFHQCPNCGLDLEAAAIAIRKLAADAAAKQP